MKGVHWIYIYIYIFSSRVQLEDFRGATSSCPFIITMDLLFEIVEGKMKRKNEKEKGKNNNQK